MIHLTNDAVQSKNSSFGKFEDYNKMNFEGFKKYLEKQNIPEFKFDEAFKRMKNIAYYLIASVSPKIKRYQYTFEVFVCVIELFGLDFMLDDNLNPYLIEANSNPCLDTKGPILTKIIRNLVDNVIMTAIDPLFPPPK
jgi:tubulin monoglycylase TTLL3/8